MPTFQRAVFPSGAALIITLSVLAMLTLLVVGMAVSMRVEQIAARNNTYNVQAQQYAASALDEALYLIRANTPIINSNTFYVTQPGRIVRMPLLASGVSTDLLFSVSTATTDTNNLNRDQSVIAATSIYDTTDKRQIVVNWINIGTNAQVAAAGNPLIGRYAFWVDDEASKININAANRRSSVFGPHPQNLDLRAVRLESGMTGNVFTVTEADTSWTYATNTGFFTTEQWKVPYSIATAPGYFATNKFYLTAYSQDLDLTPWGTVRTNLNSVTFDTLTNLFADAQLTNWFPISHFATRTFTEKYTAQGSKQIAANIVDFRDADDNSSGDLTVWPYTYCGLEDTPYLSEIIVSGSANTVNSNAAVTAEFELINCYDIPKGNGYRIIASYTITNASTTASVPGLPYSATDVCFPGPTCADTFGSDVPAKGHLAYPVVTLFETNDAAIATLTDLPQIGVVFSKVVLINNSALVVDFSRDLTNPPPWSGSQYIAVPTNGTSASRSIGVNDPRANDSMTMIDPLDGATVLTLWDEQTAATGTPNAQNSNYSLGGITTTTATDLTNDGTETSPASAQATNSNYYIKNAPFDSVGELGYIHTGRPWRSLRFQPVGTVTRINIPDWAMLDLFTTTNAPAGETGIAGRLNLNCIPTHLTSVTMPWRLIPLTSLASDANSPIGTGSWPADSSASVISNIYNWVPVTTYTAPSVAPWNQFAGFYVMRGQLCEVEKVANTVKSGANNDATREARVASIIDLITVRSDAFTVHGLGQVIQDVNKNGVYDAGDLILGEARIQAVVQRVQNLNNTPTDPYDDTLSYKVVYFRYLE